jgi:hypothetical protein
MTAQPLRLDDLLEKALAARPARELLSGLGAKISVASELPSRAEPREPLATGVVALDRLLCGGLPKGKLVELVGRRSSGRFSIGLAAIASVTSAGEPAALVDQGGHLDPESAVRIGVDLERLLWVRPRRVKESLASAEMLLAAGFPLVVADLGLSPRGARYVPDAAWLRLARAAAAQGSVLLLLTPCRMSGIAADAVLTAESVRPRWQGAGETPRLLNGLGSRLTLQKLARQSPGTAASLSLTLFPLPSITNPQLRMTNSSRGERSRIQNPESKIQNPSVHLASLEIRDPRPQLRNSSPPLSSPRSVLSSLAPITNPSAPLTILNSQFSTSS